MTENAAYTSLNNRRRMLGISLRQVLLIYLIFNTAILITYAQDYQGEYDEISVFIDVPGIGAGEINSVIRGEELFLPITDLFDFLRIRNVPDPNLDNVTGFLVDQKSEYRVDRVRNVIVFEGKTTRLDTGALIRTETNLFLRCDYFRVFGLNCEFSFRNLTVILKTDIELPSMRELKQEEMRKNLSRIKGEISADTTISRRYPLFHFGMADWSAIATEYSGGESDARLNLALGGIIAGGETTVGLNYNSALPFTEKQQYYLWRYANNDNRVLRQVMAGKIASHAISSIYNPVIGIQLTNTPTTFRRSFGTYTLTDNTEPGWLVELYVNNVLVDFVKADASGFFTFEVPLVYGNTFIMLKFYGPWGEERTREQNISIPFNFVPKNSLEYSVSAGVVEDTSMSRFSRASFNYGLTGGITIGAGMEYLSSITSAPAMPYVNASLRLASNLLISGEYTHNVRTVGNLSFRLPSNLQLDLDYTLYDRDQKAINYNYNEQRKATVSLPLKMKRLMMYNRLSVEQLVLPAIDYTTGEWMMSGSLFGLNTNLSTIGLFVGERNPYVYSNLSFAIKLPATITLIPQAQYGYTEKSLLTAKVRVEKMFARKAFLNLSYERNFRNNVNLGEIGLRYDFRFAQTGASARRSENSTILVQYARGSLINNSRTGFLGTDNRTNVGRGGISILPFLDVNGDGRWDKGEPKVHGLALRPSSGRVEYSENDTIIRIFNLEPYTNCFIEFEQASLDNISWRLKNNTISVAVDPNMLKLVELPVLVAGEAAGTIMLESHGARSGLGRMTVNFFSPDNRLVGRVLSEEDGYFSYLGLRPGSYTARLDTAQLRKLGMLTDTTMVNFKIAANIDGDFIDDIDFMIKIESDTAEAEYVAVTEPSVKKIRTTAINDTSYIIVHEEVRELVTITEDGYALQLGAFLRKDYAEAYRRRIESLTNKKVEIVLEDGFYKLRIMDMKTRAEAEKYIAMLKDDGISQVWLLTLKAMSKHMLLTQQPDTLLSVPAPADTSLVSFYTDMAIQVGAFRNETYAKAFREKIAFMINKNVTIVKEDGWNKVRISGFASAEDLEKHLPVLGLSGIRDMWIVSVKDKPGQLVADKPAVTEKQAVEEKPVIAEKPAVTFKPDSALKVEKPVVSITPDTFPQREEKPDPVVLRPVTTTTPVEKPDSTKLPPVEQPGAPVTPPEPTVSLQVALFNKRNLAERAQKRITDKLHLPVEIVEQWGYYKVVVTGFYTREETYKYYPELAGLGYPNITLIEEK